MLYARDILFVDYSENLLSDEKKIAEIRSNIQQGDIYIVKNVVDKAFLKQIRNYLIQIGKNSLPNYRTILPGCPNFHRMNDEDDRAYVKGCFHQFVFFPWNQDVFHLFEKFRFVYYLKNLLSGLRSDIFLSREPEEDCIARLAFQYYPKNKGYLNAHADPVDYHQLTVPTMMLSKKGEDFLEGGAYVMSTKKNKIYVDDFLDWGDVVYFNASVIHGVDPVDPGVEENWLSFEGRWILLFAVNKLASNQRIGQSVDVKTELA